MSIVKKIKEVRKAKGYSQEYMAGKLGITQSAYCKMENDDRKINFQNINVISSALGMEVLELIKIN